MGDFEETVFRNVVKREIGDLAHQENGLNTLN